MASNQTVLKGSPDALMLSHPHPFPTRTSQRIQTPRVPSAFRSTVTWSRVTKTDRTFRTTVQGFSEAVRQCHRRQIHWPSKGRVETFEDYCLQAFLDPVLGLFNQLKSRSIQSMFEPRMLVSDENCVAVTIRSQVFDHQVEPVCPPIFAFMPLGSLRGLHSPLLVPPAQWELLQRAWLVSPNASVVAVDFESAITISRAPDGSLQRNIFEDLGIRSDLCALRIALAAYLHRSLPKHMSIQCPEEPSSFKMTYPIGPSISPRPPLKTDAEVFATHHRHSDFDIHTLYRHRDHALQFFRWKQYVSSTISPVLAHRGDELQATTHGFSRRYLDIVSCFPVEDIPRETAEHIRATRRLQDFEDTTGALKSSERFSIELTDDTTINKSIDWMCRTYRCRIASIDGHRIPRAQSPVLFLKLFDDRFHTMKNTMEEFDVLAWWDSWTTAEEQVRAESSAYNRLQFLQGSLIPHYHGAHSFVLPTGHRLFGILMEDVGAPTIGKGVDQLSQESQVQLTKSLRHAVRALQYANVSQHDWHEDQILWKTIPAPDGSSHVHCVLVDFASTSQDTHDLEDRAADDVGLALRVLVEYCIGLDRELVYSSWEPRETWDLRRSEVDVNGVYREVPCQPDPFGFVYKNT